MKKTIIWITSVIGMAATVVLAYTYFIGYNAQQNISVAGQCITSAPKDRTAITLTVRTLDDNPATSMKIASAKMSEITAFLKTMDVEMQTTEFDSYEKTEWDNQTQKSIVLGTETNIAIEVSSDKMEDIEIVLGKFAGTDNIYTSGLRMFTSAAAMQPIMDKCLADAVNNARARAQIIAQAGGKSIGKLIHAEYGNNKNSNQPAPSNMLRMGKMEAASFDMAGGLVSKDTVITVDVQASFELK